MRRMDEKTTSPLGSLQRLDSANHARRHDIARIERDSPSPTRPASFSSASVNGKPLKDQREIDKERKARTNWRDP